MYLTDADHAMTQPSYKHMHTFMYHSLIDAFSFQILAAWSLNYKYFIILLVLILVESVNYSIGLISFVNFNDSSAYLDNYDSDFLLQYTLLSTPVQYCKSGTGLP